MKKIVILASGGGSNAQKIMEHFAGSDLAKVVLVVSNNSSAGVLEKADRFGVPTLVHGKEDYTNGNLLKIFKDLGVDLIVLAGYLKKVGDEIISYYSDKIVNIHPALLPKYGGKGMYGMNVHRAVVAAGESKTGITIHFVNENYDEGAIILQKECSINDTDSTEEVAAKVLALEHHYFAPCIEELLRNENDGV